MTTRFKFTLFGACCALFALLNGCATATRTATKSYAFFPPAPDEPHLQFLTSFSSEVDLGRNSGFIDFVTGQRTSPNPLVKPYGLAVRDGKVFVCDTMASAVQVFDLARKRARYFAPQGEGRLLMPIHITIDGDGTRYVADTSRNQVVIYTKNGDYLAAMGVKDEMKPCDVAVTADRLYVADLKGHAVRVYDKAQRQLLFSIPRDPKAAEGRLFSPTNLAIDRERGRLLVSDTGGFAVQVYDLEGKFLRAIGRQGVGFGAFARPKGVAVDRAGLAYVVDASTYVVQLFDPEGKLLLFFGQPGASMQGELALPAGVEIDYENVSYFQKFVAPGFECEYLILVTSQPPPSLGAAKVSVYGFVKKK
jgi:DNA-binding beta-propeller fold protein YncE